MSTTYVWSINQMERLTSDGFVVTVHYNVSATDGDYSAFTYGTCSYTQENKPFVPYDDLTEEIVVDWVQTSLGKETIETFLQNKIDAQKHPVQQLGLPW